MSEPNTKAAGYVRVSSKEQVDNESLSTQRTSIKDFAKQQGWRLTDVYADEGISGGGVKERPGLLRCLHDGQAGRFDVLVIHRLSRFGRNARELLNNHAELEKAGIQLRSVAEGIDFGSKYGRAMLGMFAVMAELEKDIIRETMLENRIARGRKGRPTAGNLPFGRTFDKETGEWGLDEEAARLIRWAAREFLNGASLQDLADDLKTRHGLDITYGHLLRVLQRRCGSTWTVRFKDEEPITYEVPPILDEATIQRVKERIEHNTIASRPDVKRYVLAGFLRCEKCAWTLQGQTQRKPDGRVYVYYKHPSGRRKECSERFSVPLERIERAVFATIFENVYDAPSFERAIAESLPDEKMVASLEAEVKAREKGLKGIARDLDKLIDLALSGSLKKATIKEREAALLESRERAEEALEAAREKLRSLPDLEQIKAEAEAVRRQLLEEFSGPDRLARMSFDEQKELLYWLFGGKDAEGRPYGIYVSKRGRDEFDYFLYGRITGLRTLKGDDIDHDPGADSGDIKPLALLPSRVKSKRPLMSWWLTGRKASAPSGPRTRMVFPGGMYCW